MTSIEVILSEDTPGLVRVELIAKGRHTDVLVASEDGHDVIACFDTAIRKMERQLTREKGIKRGHRHAGKKGLV